MDKPVRKVAGALATERVLSFLGELFVGGPMLYTAVVYGPVYCFAVGWVLELLFCLAVLWLQVFTRKRGHDLTGVTEIKEFIHEPIPKKEGPVWGKLGRGTARAVQFLLRLSGLESYIPMVFFWSVFYVEADYVTLFLRKKGEAVFSVVDRVMLPAVTWSIGVWTLIFYFAVEGVEWAASLAGL